MCDQKNLLKLKKLLEFELNLMCPWKKGSEPKKLSTRYFFTSKQQNSSDDSTQDPKHEYIPRSFQGRELGNFQNGK